MQKILFTIDEVKHDEKFTHTVNSFILCAGEKSMQLWSDNKAMTLNNGDTIRYQQYFLTVHIINERNQAVTQQKLNWLSPLQTDLNHQTRQLSHPFSHTATDPFDPLAFLAPATQAPDIFSPAISLAHEPVSYRAPEAIQKATEYANKPKLLERIKQTSKKIWRTTKPGVNQW